jgi:hypothetical protein
MAARKNMKNDDAAAGYPAAAGQDGAEVVEERVEVVRYAARGRCRQGVRDGVHPGAGEPAGPQAAAGVAGRGHL